MTEWYSDPTIQVVAIGGFFIGSISGALGSITYLRGQSLLADIVGHSSLLGIVLGFWIAYALGFESPRSKAVLVPSAMLAGLLAVGLVNLIQSRTLIKSDAAMGLMLALFFGTGLSCLQFIERVEPPIPERSGLRDYLFGMAAATNRNDVIVIGGIGVVVLVLLLVCWRHIVWMTFDTLHQIIDTHP